MSLPRTLRKLRLLLTDPARYSAEWYREKNRMDLSATQPATWRTDVGPRSSR